MGVWRTMTRARHNRRRTTLAARDLGFRHLCEPAGVAHATLETEPTKPLVGLPPSHPSPAPVEDPSDPAYVPLPRSELRTVTGNWRGWHSNSRMRLRIDRNGNVRVNLRGKDGLIRCSFETSFARRGNTISILPRDKVVCEKRFIRGDWTRISRKFSGYKCEVNDTLSRAYCAGKRNQFLMIRE